MRLLPMPGLPELVVVAQRAAPLPGLPRGYPQTMIEFDRSTGIGGSDVAAVLGINPWRSSFDVYLEKTRDPSWSPSEENARMRLGKLLEPALRTAYEQDHPGVKVVHKDKTLWHTRGVCYAHLDGLTLGHQAPYDDGVWEGKSARDDRDWQEGVPEYYESQVRQYLAITGEPWCDVTVLFLHNAEIAHYRVDADPDTDNGIIELMERFWHERVVPRVPPEIDGSDAAARFLSLRHPIAPVMEPPLVASRAVDSVGQALGIIMANEKQLADAKKNAQNAIKKAMGEYGAITGTGWRATWKRSRGATSVAWEQVAAAYRTLIERVDALLRESKADDEIVRQAALRVFSDAPLDDILSLYTTTAAGSHPFVFKQDGKGG